MSFFPLLFSVLLLGCLNGTLNFCVDLFLLRFRASEKNPIFLFVPRISLSHFGKPRSVAGEIHNSFERRRPKT